jgi:CRP-like cAMP-binding protein
MEDRAFSRSPLLGRIGADDLRTLARIAIRRSFAPGQIMFLRGDPGDGVLAIVSGRVRVFVEGGNGGDVSIGVRGEGDVLGELSLLDGLPRTASGRAIDAVTALFVSRDAFRTWLDEHPAAARAMLEVLARRVREATDQVASMALLSVEARLARRLHDLFAEAAADGPPRDGASLTVNQAELASSIGVTRESVNKHLARMKQSGIVNTGGGTITLLDVRALQQLFEEL